MTLLGGQLFEAPYAKCHNGFGEKTHLLMDAVRGICCCDSGGEGGRRKGPFEFGLNGTDNSLVGNYSCLVNCRYNFARGIFALQM